MTNLQSTNTIVPGPQVETSRPFPEPFGFTQIPWFHLFGFLLDKRIAVLRKAAGGCQQQALMARTFGKETFDQLEAKRESAANQFRIVV